MLTRTAVKSLASKYSLRWLNLRSSLNGRRAFCSRVVSSSTGAVSSPPSVTSWNNEPRRGLSIQRLGADANPNMSSAVVHGGVLTTMGVIDIEGKTVAEKTQNILDKIDTLLEEGGTDRSKLLTANIWLKDIGSNFATMNDIWVKWIHVDNKPIRACVEANLAFPTLLVEIQVTAAV